MKICIVCACTHADQLYFQGLLHFYLKQYKTLTRGSQQVERTEFAVKKLKSALFLLFSFI